MVYWKLEVALAHRALQTQLSRLDAVSYLSRPARIALVFRSLTASLAAPIINYSFSTKLRRMSVNQVQVFSVLARGFCPLFQ
jgi:hypothetical protein